MNQNISHIKLGSKSYPFLLSQISSPPKSLYVRGDETLLNSQYLIAVVGTRTMTEYGRKVLREIIPALVRAGAVIVSGLAFGVDAFAHEVTLDSGGKGIAVLGSGVDCIFPRFNERLAHRLLAAGGSIVSEHPPGTEPRKQFFPARNRIISGLSKAVLVIEAGERSGALITSKFALDQDREVYALPGDISAENSKGTNRLIAQGATPILSAEQLLESLQLSIDWSRQKEPVQLQFDTDDEKLIYECLQAPQSIDEMTKNTKLALSVINQVLTLMEIKGLVRKTSPTQYERV
jgi:DNA processing protein